MKNLLIISSTKNTNLDLSYEIKKYLDNYGDEEISILSLEEYDLPLYTPTLEEKFKQNNSFPETIEGVKKILINSRAIIWCSPEYNGGISPIVTNTIAWISRATEDWREAFKDKKILICSSSGGNGKNFIKGFRMQLDYLGSNVSEDYIIRTKKNGGDKDNFEQILTKFYKQLNN